MNIPYGYYVISNGHVAVDIEKANIVRVIYQQYLAGKSLGGIADFLFKHGISSPKGKDRWTQAVISDLLSNQKYIGHIIEFRTFFLSKRKRTEEAILMKSQINARPLGTTLRVY